MPFADVPIKVPVNIFGVFTVHPKKFTLQTTCVGIRVTNKGPFDVQISGPTGTGFLWVIAGTSIFIPMNYHGGTSEITLVCYSTCWNERSIFYDIALFSTIVITEYLYGDDLPDTSTYQIPLVTTLQDVRVISAPACQGTTITLPNSTNTLSDGNCYLLGFTLTSGIAAAAASADLVIDNVNIDVSPMKYRLHSDTTIPFQLIERYPPNGIPNASNQNIDFVVPTVSTLTIDLIIFYTWTPGVFV